ncbi:uncharacterized protein UTRI_02670 [Ustilago trichophora]|uniref:Uncharacterized protein n=1 Tax=Ustilago trichophora TaxID=86804 RepID=A0A5C3ENA1_9BASI|nr:uncharacterized protein UTRI_02670 [Ustilago trichophora]
MWGTFKPRSSHGEIASYDSSFNPFQPPSLNSTPTATRSLPTIDCASLTHNREISSTERSTSLQSTCSDTAGTFADLVTGLDIIFRAARLFHGFETSARTDYTGKAQGDVKLVSDLQPRACTMLHAPSLDLARLFEESTPS